MKNYLASMFYRQKSKDGITPLPKPKTSVKEIVLKETKPQIFLETCEEIKKTVVSDFDDKVVKKDYLPQKTKSFADELESYILRNQSDIILAKEV